MKSEACLVPHRPHLSRALAASSLPAPHACTSSSPFSVRADPQSPHSIRTLAPKRTRSAPVWICLVDIGNRYPVRNI